MMPFAHFKDDLLFKAGIVIKNEKPLETSKFMKTDTPRPKWSAYSGHCRAP